MLDSCYFLNVCNLPFAAVAGLQMAVDTAVCSFLNSLLLIVIVLLLLAVDTNLQMAAHF